MKRTMLSANMKRPLLLAIAATFAAACATTEPVYYAKSPEPTSWVGPAGPAGPTGATGMTELAGITGPIGATGATGPQGSIGATGAQGAIGSVGGNNGWNLYRAFTFEGRSDDITGADSNKARDIANYLNRNPSFRVAIDGPSARYVHSVVDALKDAGVPASKLQTSAFGDPPFHSDRRVD